MTANPHQFATKAYWRRCLDDADATWRNADGTPNYPAQSGAFKAIADAILTFGVVAADDSYHEGPPEPESYPEESQEAHDRSDDDIFA